MSLLVRLGDRFRQFAGACFWFELLLTVIKMNVIHFLLSYLVRFIYNKVMWRCFLWLKQ